MTPEILPCPFCGGEAGLGTSGITQGKQYYFVNCINCLVSNNLIADMQIFDKCSAIEHWNKRVVK